MPWKITENDDRCPASKPYAVVGGQSGNALFGCHTTQESAREQQKALYASESSSAGRPNVAQPYTLADTTQIVARNRGEEIILSAAPPERAS